MHLQTRQHSDGLSIVCAGSTHVPLLADRDCVAWRCAGALHPGPGHRLRPDRVLDDPLPSHGVGILLLLLRLLPVRAHSYNKSSSLDLINFHKQNEAQPPCFCTAWHQCVATCACMLTAGKINRWPSSQPAWIDSLVPMLGRDPAARLRRVLTLFTFFGQFLVYVSPSIQMAQIMASGVAPAHDGPSPVWRVTFVAQHMAWTARAP